MTISKNRWQKLAGIITESKSVLKEQMDDEFNLVGEIDKLDSIVQTLSSVGAAAQKPELLKKIDKAIHMVEIASSLISDIKKDYLLQLQVKRNIAADEEASANYLYSAEDFLTQIEDYGAPDEVDAESLMSALEEDGFLNAGDQDSVIAAEAAIEEYLYQ